MTLEFARTCLDARLYVHVYERPRTQEPAALPASKKEVDLPPSKQHTKKEEAHKGSLKPH